jgi:hypothetical protein
LVMKAQTLFLSGLLTIITSFTLVACNKTSSDTAAPGAIPPPSCVNGLCTNGAWAGWNGSPTNIGFYAQTSNFGSYVQGFTSASSLNLTSGWKTMLKDAMGVCDRDQSNGGLAGCNDWMNGMHDLVIIMDSSTASTVRVTVRSYPVPTNPYYSYSYSLPSATDFFYGLLGFPIMGNPSGFFNPMILTASIWPVNNSQGFEVRSLGPQQSYGWNKYLQLQIANGKVEDQSFQYQLFWNAQLAASGTMIRCQTQTCGL